MSYFHFNNLTPAENERLSMLIEEFCEAGQIIGKIGRHGYESYNPYDAEPETNRQLLRKEVLDALGVIALMVERGDMAAFSDEEIQASKVKRASRFTHHQNEE
jgi:hypothetical protein